MVRPGIFRVGSLAAVAAVMLTAASPADAVPEPGQSTLLGKGLVHRVTLVTGDRVTVADLPDGHHGVLVEPGAGRDGIAFGRQAVVDEQSGGENLYVLPSDAVSLVASGVLDRELFDVTKLVRDGYDDASRPDLPLIMSYPSAAGLSQHASMSVQGVSGGVELPSIGGLSVVQRKDQASQFWGSIAGQGELRASSGLTKVWLDAKVQVDLAESVPQIGAPAAWQAGLTGKNVKVAVLDTGVDASHPDLAGKVADSRDFTANPNGTKDGYGHGTHVASTVAGSGAASGGKYKGVAPDATLLVGKVLDDRGSGATSWIVAGMEWAARSGAKVISMSLGGWPSDGTDPMSQAVNNISRDSGALFTIAAGNWGGRRSISTPAAADAALTVGAVTKKDVLAPFSSQGPRLGDYAVKPDLTAPGVDIVAARAAGTSLGTPVDANYTQLSGTSMATPHVAGAAAILAQQHPDWTGQQLKAALMSASKVVDPALTVYQQGAGRVDVARVVSQPVVASVGSISYGRQAWPHNQKPIDKSVVYTNSSGTAVDLTPSLTVTDERGAPAPAGLFAVPSGPITVPAHGQASVTVTANTAAVGTAVGTFSGRLSAVSADGAVMVQTALGIATDPEMFQLTVNFIDRDGKPLSDSLKGLNILFLAGDNAGDFPRFLQPKGGQVSARLPKSVYSLASYMSMMAPDGKQFASVTVAGAPRVDLNKDTTITFDARQGTKASVRVDRPTATPVWGELGFMLHRAFRQQISASFPPGVDLYGVPVEGDAADAAHFTSSYKVQLTTDGPFYNLGFGWPGKIPSLALTVHDNELARVQAKFTSKTDQRTVVGRANFVFLPGEFAAGGTLTKVDQPGERTELVSPDPAATASFLFRDAQGRDFAGLTPATTARADGSVVIQEWNRAVEGPGLPPGPKGPFPYAFQDATSISTGVPLFSDSSQGVISITDPRTVTGKLTLYRNGEEVGSSADVSRGQFAVPGDQADYRLTAVADRKVPWSQLSTHVESAWSFSSAAPTDPAVRYRPLPLFAVKFMPQLDEYNRAPAEGRFRIPLRVEWNPGSPQTTVDDLSVEVSYDDGVHWREADVERTDEGRAVAVVKHPPLARTSGFVSLRVRAHDSDDNSVEHTVIRAYKLVEPVQR